jgi:phosphate transport system permease protein
MTDTIAITLPTDDAVAPVAALEGLRTPTEWASGAMQGRIRNRYRSERWFKYIGMFAVILSASFLAFLLITMVSAGFAGLRETRISLPIDFTAAPGGADANMVRASGAAALQNANLDGVIAFAAQRRFGAAGPSYFSTAAKNSLQEAIINNPDMLMGKAVIALPASAEIDAAAKGRGKPDVAKTVAGLRQRGDLSSGISWSFLTRADATDPTMAGIWGALKGSLLTLLVTLALAFPIGVMTAVYLEEYAPNNRWSDILEVSINNLAAVPSIIFGLLALAVFLNWFGLPRSSPLVGGMTLALMTMPVIVVAARNALKAVPPSIRDAALGVGASPVQVVFHHVLPLALPGIMTGTIIGMSRALGETAPLLLIGMRGFIADVPSGITDPATVLPMQIFLWSDEVDPGFVAKTSAAAIVLLLVLLSMNAIAVYIRNRFEKRW